MGTRTGDQSKLIGYVTRGLALVIPLVGLVAVLDIPFYVTQVSLFSQQYMALFWGLAGALVFLTVPPRKGSSRASVPWYDVVLAAACLIVGLYVAVLYPKILSTIGVIDAYRVVLGLVAIVLVLESTRRLEGWPLTIMVTAILAYALLGKYIPGPLGARAITWPRLVSQLYLGADALFGTPLKMAVIVVFAYMLFGTFLASSGGSEFLTGVANALMGKRRGGPAKAAVIASALLGGFSSSAVGNVATIGTITIPMMRRAGYPPTFAAAVEAVSATGDILIPPIMGAAAFIMAEFLGVPYATVALAALVPALLYYLGDFMQIDLRAAKLGLTGLPSSDIPSLASVLRSGWYFLVPIATLIYTLFVLYLRPELSALIAVASLLVIALVKKDLRSLFRSSRLLFILEATTKAMLEITVVCAAAGLIVGVVAITGLGFSLSLFLTHLSGGNLLLLALLTALASTILGMGMPATACYVFLAVIAAPAMVALNVPPLLAHLFVYYFGTFSYLTPPVCLAVYAAASIAGSRVISTGFQAMRLAIAGYLVPFFFLYRPGLALLGPPEEVAWTILCGAIAVIFLAAALEGYLLRPMGWIERLIFGGAGLSLFAPGLMTDITGLVVGAATVVVHYLRSRGASVMVRPSGALERKE